MILVVGPKDLPAMLRSFGKAVRGMRRMAGDFQRQFDDALREAELDDVKRISKSSVLKPLEDARESIQSAQKQVTDTFNEPVEKEPASKTKVAEPEVRKTEPAKPKPAKSASAASGKPPSKAGKVTKPAKPKTEKPKSPAKTPTRRKAGGAATGIDA